MPKLTKKDLLALDRNDVNYFVKMGSDNYGLDYELSHLYYTIAATMGNTRGMVGLGYLYMYARLGVKRMDLAYTYFKTAADLGDPEANYKLGTLYATGEAVLKDKELAMYYYERAFQILEDHQYDYNWIGQLCLSVGIEKMDGGYYETDPYGAYMLLTRAKNDLKAQIDYGASFRIKQYEKAVKLLEDPVFDHLHKMYLDNANEVYQYRFTTEVTPFIDYYAKEGVVVRFIKDYEIDLDYANEIYVEDLEVINKGMVGTVVREYPYDMVEVLISDNEDNLIANLCVSIDYLEIVEEEE